MTNTLPREITHCYSLLFTGDAEQKNKNYLRAALCFEECRMLAEIHLDQNPILAYALFRSARKEAQMLILLNAEKRAFRMLRKLMSHNYIGGNSFDRLFIYSQLSFLAEKVSQSKNNTYKNYFHSQLKQLIHNESI